MDKNLCTCESISTWMVDFWHENCTENRASSSFRMVLTTAVQGLRMSPGFAYVTRIGFYYLLTTLFIRTWRRWCRCRTMEVRTFGVFYFARRPVCAGFASASWARKPRVLKEKCSTYVLVRTSKRVNPNFATSLKDIWKWFLKYTGNNTLT